MIKSGAQRYPQRLSAGVSLRGFSEPAATTAGVLGVAPAVAAGANLAGEKRKSRDITRRRTDYRRGGGLSVATGNPSGGGGYRCGGGIRHYWNDNGGLHDAAGAGHHVSRPYTGAAGAAGFMRLWRLCGSASGRRLWRLWLGRLWLGRLQRRRLGLRQSR